MGLNQKIKKLCGRKKLKGTKITDLENPKSVLLRISRKGGNTGKNYSTPTETIESKQVLTHIVSKDKKKNTLTVIRPKENIKDDVIYDDKLDANDNITDKINSLIGELEKDMEIFNTDKIEIILNTDKGTYQCECEIENETADSSLRQIIELRQTSECVVSNRRESHRIELNQDFEYKFEQEIMSGKLLDISTTGIKFSSAIKHKLDDVIIFEVHNENIILAIKRQEPSKEGCTDNIYGAKIIHNEEMLSKYAFEKQTEMLRIRKYKKIQDN